MTDRVDGTHADDWCRERVVAELCDPGAGVVADLSTIRFEREVVAGSHRAIHASVGQAEVYASRPRVGDQRQHFAFFFETEPDRWSLTSWMNVGDGEGLPGRGPRGLLGGGVDADGLNAAGRVFTDGHDVDRVQIRLSDGTVIEDHADHLVLLFLADGPVHPPATAALLGRDGHDLATHPVLPG
jgi:hypothetical protein